MDMFEYGDFTREQNIATLIGEKKAREFIELENNLNKSLKIEVRERGRVEVNPEEQAVEETPSTPAVTGTPDGEAYSDEDFNELVGGGGLG